MSVMSRDYREEALGVPLAPGSRQSQADRDMQRRITHYRNTSVSEIGQLLEEITDRADGASWDEVSIESLPIQGPRSPVSYSRNVSNSEINRPLERRGETQRFSWDEHDISIEPLPLSLQTTQDLADSYRQLTYAHSRHSDNVSVDEINRQFEGRARIVDETWTQSPVTHARHASESQQLLDQGTRPKSAREKYGERDRTVNDEHAWEDISIQPLRLPPQTTQALADIHRKMTHTVHSSPQVLNQNPEIHTHSRNESLSEDKRLLAGRNERSEHKNTVKIRFSNVYSPELQEVWPKWSEEPVSLNKSFREKLKGVVVNLFFLGISLPFFALAGSLLWENGKVQEERNAEVLRECILAAATLFPLCFSLVVGRLSIKLASFKIERGTTLGFLERLVGSQTVGGTIFTQFRLWPLSFLAFGLVLLWLLSPLGSQAILRTLSTTLTSINSTTNITYISTRQASYSGTSQFYNEWFPGFAGLFGASLLAPQPVKFGPSDLWGNVKIPILSNTTSSDWSPVPQDDTVTYTSLFGIPISGSKTGTGNTTFTIESTYISLSCFNRTSNVTRAPTTEDSLSISPRLPPKFYNPGLISTTGPFIAAQNITATTEWAVGYLGTDITDLLPSNTTLPSLDALPSHTTTEPPGLLLYQDFSGSRNVTSIFCTPSQNYVESQILCTTDFATEPISQSCGVVAQRRSSLPNAPISLTYMSFKEVFLGISELLSQSYQTINGADLLQNYLFSPNDNAFIQSTRYAKTAELESRFDDVDLELFGERLGAVLNTFLQGSQLNASLFITGSGLPTPETPATTNASLFSGIQAISPVLAIPGNSTTNERVFTVSYIWLGLFLGATTAMLLSAIAAAVLSHLTILPQYLNSVSSLVRESGNVGMPPGGANLSGMQKSRKLKNLGVKLGDIGEVSDGWSVGTGVRMGVSVLGLGTRDGETRRVGRERMFI